MAKYTINESEMFPVWEIVLDGQPTGVIGARRVVDLTEAEYARVQAAFDEFEACQSILKGKDDAPA